MLKIKNKMLTIAVVIFIFTISMFLTACGGVKEGQYSENGLKFEVKNNSAVVVGVENNVTEVNIPTKFKGFGVVGINENAFENSKIKKVTFNQESYSNFYILKNVFNNSDVETIENLPANVNLDQNSFVGIKNLKNISTYGSGKLSVENGALIENSNNTKILKLLPSGVMPQNNFNNGVYTITGFNTISSNAISNNQFITDIIIAEDVKTINAKACEGVNLNSITIENLDYFDLFIDSNAFTITKNLKIFIPATTNNEMNSWLTYSKNLIYNYNWIIHPVECKQESAHIHGIRNTMVKGSLEGYEYNPLEETANFNVGSYWISGVEIPDYVK